jgi:hypothetical protein
MSSFVWRERLFFGGMLFWFFRGCDGIGRGSAKTGAAGFLVP